MPEILNSTDFIEKVEKISERRSKNPVKQALLFYLDKYKTSRATMDELVATIHQRQDKMTFVNDVVSELNSIIDTKSEYLDLTGRDELLEKLNLIRTELGLKIPPEKLKLSQAEQNLLIENLKRGVDRWGVENQSASQKVDIRTKHLDTVMMILKGLEKTMDRIFTGTAKAFR